MSELTDNQYYEMALEDYKHAINSYSEIPSAKKYSCWWSSAVAFKFVENGVQKVVFRGTDRLPDWFFNLLAFVVTYRGYKMHLGFAIVHWSIWRKVVKDLDKDSPVRFIGHSLGGTTAEISTCTAGIDMFRSVMGVFYGKPNVFKKGQFMKFPIWLGKMVSVVNPCDPVTMVPAVQFGPFNQQIKLVLTAEDDEVHLNPPSGLIKRWISLEGFYNHMMSEYGSRLKTAKTLRLY